MDQVTTRLPRLGSLSRGPMIAGGSGAEGAVYEVLDHPTLLIKVYHKPLPPLGLARLERVIACGTPKLIERTAWPMAAETINGETVILMRRVVGGKPVHELYDRGDRAVYFPHADWQSLLQAAISVAHGFAAVHEAGFCVVDVSENNVLISPDCRATLIDCDSCVPQNAGEMSISPLETAFWLAPELIGAKTQPRRPNHDNFGLARLVFLLLFEGSDPLTTVTGDGDAAPERVFAFSQERIVRTPLPDELRLSDLSPQVATLFERAFSPAAGRGLTRPTAEQWVSSLQAMDVALRRCNVDVTHWRVGIKPCPWCEIKKRVERPVPPPPPLPTPVQPPRAGFAQRHPVVALLGILLLVWLAYHHLSGGNPPPAPEPSTTTVPAPAPAPEPSTTTVPAPAPEPSTTTVPAPEPSTPEESNLVSTAEATEQSLALTFYQRQTVQRVLRRQHLYRGSIDGAFGPGTRAAILQFQANKERPATGYLDADLLAVFTSMAQAEEEQEQAPVQNQTVATPQTETQQPVAPAMNQPDPDAGIDSQLRRQWLQN